MTKVYIYSKRCSFKPESDGIVLTEKDFNPCHSFFQDHPDIIPESVDEIRVKGILEDNQYIRCILKNINWMLKVGGNIFIDLFNNYFAGYGYAVRTEDDVAYEIACAFHENLLLRERHQNEVVTRVYEKVKSALHEGDDIGKWSFGIVSNGSRNERILEIGERIKSLGIPNFEVLVCGPSPSDCLPEYMRVVDEKPFYNDTRIPLCKKKNAIVDAARYENLVIIHDRINFDVNWFNQIKTNGNYFEALIPAILDENSPSNHMIDNAHYREKNFNKWYRFRHERKWSPYLYMDGGILIMKKDLAMTSRMANYLHWGEKEDVDFAKRIYLNGGYIYKNHDIIVFSNSKRRKTQKICPAFVDYLKVPFSFLKWCGLWCNEYIKFLSYLHK